MSNTQRNQSPSTVQFSQEDAGEELPADVRAAEYGRSYDQRVTLRVSQDHLEAAEALVDAGVCPNRSAAFRAGLERILQEVEADE